MTTWTLTGPASRICGTAEGAAAALAALSAAAADLISTTSAGRLTLGIDGAPVAVLGLGGDATRDLTILADAIATLVTDRPEITR